MGLAQIKPEDRIIFLKKFAAELVINCGEPTLIEEKIRKQIEIEKLRQKFLRPIETKSEDAYQGFQKSISDSFFQQPVYSKKTEESEQRPEIKVMKKRFMFPRRPLFQRTNPPQQIPVRRLRKSISTASANTPPPTPSQQLQPSMVQPEAHERPEGLDLGKIQQFLKDPSIQSIECPGPGRNLLLKRYSKINTTKVTLNQVEITNIINTFAQQARIPIVGGILKAAVGDLVISAVISEFVGSRFILSKIVPYNLMGIQ
ncbi:MAG: hypothetical protein PHH54_05800 [Candidatus Nanoarchaeia archaeon]|nr:hypothetical protein [Candidatus Nanoarchaeia archaeon]MDD5741469.1 hypothetical protein [Candidatus Nanoarchaeia archaeon]